MNENSTKNCSTKEVSLYFDCSLDVLRVFNPSIVIVWILLKLVGLTILSIGLPSANFDGRSIYFTAKMPGSLQLLGHKRFYFGIPKYHLVCQKPWEGISFLQWASGDLWVPRKPNPVLLNGRHFWRWSASLLVGCGPKRNFVVLFGLCDIRSGALQVVNPSIFIVWTQLKAVGVRILSSCQHLALLRPNLSVTRHQKAISEEILK